MPGRFLLTEMFGVSEVGEALRPGECLVSRRGRTFLGQETVEVTRFLSVLHMTRRGTVLDYVRDDSLGIIVETGKYSQIIVKVYQDY